jgi:hypothetical protein
MPEIPPHTLETETPSTNQLQASISTFENGLMLLVKGEVMPKQHQWISDKSYRHAQLPGYPHIQTASTARSLPEHMVSITSFNGDVTKYIDAAPIIA